MKRKILLFSIVILYSLFLLSAERVYTLESLQISPFSSASYYGSYSDGFTNPAALPLMRDYGSFLVSYLGSDDLDLDSAKGERLSLFQNHTDKLVLSFLGNNLSLTGQFGTDFRGRSQDLENPDKLRYDVYNTIDVQIDWAYAFPYFSFGVRLAGGNSMIRPSKQIANLIDAYANALFAPFENDSGSSRFSLGAGALLYFRYGAIGLYVDEIMSLSDGALVASWPSLLSSSTLSFNVGASRINKEGELTFIRPRFSYSYTGLTSGSQSVFDLKADVAFQFLPSFSAALGISYMEYNHKFFSFNRDNGYLGLYMKGEFSFFNVLFGASLSTAGFNKLTPVIGLTYIN